MELSYWEQNSFFKNIDVAIVGSGIVGLSAAIYIKTKQPLIKVVVFERGILPSGASTKNAGFACFGSVSELLDDLSNQEEEMVFKLVEKRWKGLQKLKQSLGEQNIKYKSLGSYELFTDKDNILFEKCIDQISYFNNMIKSITGESETFQLRNKKIDDFGFNGISQLIFNASEGQLNTGAMMKALIEKARSIGVEIFNGVEITEVKDNGKQVKLAFAGGWVIQAHKVLIATNGFIKKLLPQVQLNPARNQVFITKPIAGLPFKGCFHYNKGYVYFRNVDNRILIGGGRNISFDAETTDAFGTTTIIQQYLTNLLSNHFLPNKSFEIEHWWSGILGVGNSKQPIIKKISDNIIIAVRLGGMGLAIGTLVGEEGGALALQN